MPLKLLGTLEVPAPAVRADYLLGRGAASLSPNGAAMGSMINLSGLCSLSLCPSAKDSS